MSSGGFQSNGVQATVGSVGDFADVFLSAGYYYNSGPG
jgi:hypothetical protein